jgi:hypothetical protein
VPHRRRALAVRDAVVQHDLTPAAPGGRQRDGEHLDAGGVQPAPPHDLGFPFGRQPYGGAAQLHPGGLVGAGGSQPCLRPGGDPGHPEAVRLPGAAGQRPVLQGCGGDADVPPVGRPGVLLEQGHGAQSRGAGLLPVVAELVQQGEIEPGLRQPRLHVRGTGQQRSRVLVPAVADQRERAVGGLPPGGGGPVPSLPEDPHDSRLPVPCDSRLPVSRRSRGPRTELCPRTPSSRIQPRTAGRALITHGLPRSRRGQTGRASSTASLARGAPRALDDRCDTHRAAPLMQHPGE